MIMKTILTSLLLLTCALGSAQYLIDGIKKQDTTDTNPAFAWFEKREKPHLFNEILEFESRILAENPRKEQKVKDKKGMPVYPVPSSENYPMPIQSVDSTKTKYLKVYPAQDK